MEIHVKELSLEQRRRGERVVLIFELGEITPPYVKIPRLPIPARRLSNILDSTAFYAGVFFHLGELKRTVGSQADHALIHIHGGWADFLWGGILARALDIPAIAAYHAEIRPRWAWLFKRVLASFSAIYSTGAAEAIFFQSFLKIPVAHIPSGIRQDFLQQAPALVDDQFDLVWVGSLIPRKNPQLFLDLAARRPDLRFALVGDGPLREEVEKRLQFSDLSNIQWFPSLGAQRLAETLRKSRVFVCTSLAEGTPTSMMEAMACGTAIVTTPANSLGWLVTEKAGFILADWSLDSLDKVVTGLLSDPHKLAGVRDHNRETGPSLSWPARASQIEGLMQRIIGERNP